MQKKAKIAKVVNELCKAVTEQVGTFIEAVAKIDDEEPDIDPYVQQPSMQTGASRRAPKRKRRGSTIQEEEEFVEDESEEDEEMEAAIDVDDDEDTDADESEEEDKDEDDNEEDAEEEEDEEEEEEEEEEEVVPPRSERRSKLVHDPAVERGKGVATVTQSSKRPRTTSPVPTEKAPKQSRVAPSKSAKVLPKMKMVIPTISG